MDDHIHGELPNTELVNLWSTPGSRRPRSRADKGRLGISSTFETPATVALGAKRFEHLVQPRAGTAEHRSRGPPLLNGLIQQQQRAASAHTRQVAKAGSPTAAVAMRSPAAEAAGSAIAGGARKLLSSLARDDGSPSPTGGGGGSASAAGSSSAGAGPSGRSPPVSPSGKVPHRLARLASVARSAPDLRPAGAASGKAALRRAVVATRATGLWEEAVPPLRDMASRVGGTAPTEWHPQVSQAADRFDSRHKELSQRAQHALRRFEGRSSRCAPRHVAAAARRPPHKSALLPTAAAVIWPANVAIGRAYLRARDAATSGSMLSSRKGCSSCARCASASSLSSSARRSTSLPARSAQSPSRWSHASAEGQAEPSC